MEHRAATTPLHRTRFWLVLFSSAHVVPAVFISSSVLRFQVCFWRPTLRFPWGFHSRACLVMLDTGFCSVWPIQPHLRVSISILLGVCFALFHSCLFEITSDHLMLRMFLRHLLVNACNFWVLVLVTHYVSESYSRTNFTLVLKIQIFFRTDMKCLQFSVKLSLASPCLYPKCQQISVMHAKFAQSLCAISK